MNSIDCTIDILCPNMTEPWYYTNCHIGSHNSSSFGYCKCSISCLRMAQSLFSDPVERGVLGHGAVAHVCRQGCFSNAVKIHSIKVVIFQKFWKVRRPSLIATIESHMTARIYVLLCYICVCARVCKHGLQGVKITFHRVIN